MSEKNKSPYKIAIKNRKDPARISMSVEQIKRLDSKEKLWSWFKPIREMENPNNTINDVIWLRNIVNWTPEGGTSVRMLGKWMKLIQRFNELDDKKEGHITLSQYQVDLIWNRVTSENYRMKQFPVQFIEFIAEFQSITGKRFPEEDPT